MDPSKAQNDSDVAKISWLDTFLADVVGVGHTDILTFRALAEKVDAKSRMDLARELLERRPKQHRLLHQDWKDYAGKLTQAHSSASPIAIENIATCIRQGTNGRVSVLEQFNEYVTALTEESWNEFFLTATQSGFDLVGLSQEVVALPMRKVPPLVLRDPAAATLMALINEPGGPTYNKEMIVQVLEKFGDDKDDRSGYFRTLGYASLFAHADRWPIAKLLAQRAMHIARRITKNRTANDLAGVGQSKITGREAYYFSAVTHRLTAKSVADLDECDLLIEEAKRAERLEDDFEPPDRTATAPPSPFPALTGLRMRTEKITVDVSRLLFQYFVDTADQDKEAISTSARKIMDRIDREIKSATKCMDITARSAATITLRDDFFAMILVLEHVGNLEPIDVEMAGHLFEDQLNEFEKPYVSTRGKVDGELNLSVVDIVTTTYAASFQNHSDPGAENVRRKYRLLGEIRDPRFRRSIMPYDRACFNALRILVEEHQRRNSSGSRRG